MSRGLTIVVIVGGLVGVMMPSGRHASPQVTVGANGQVETRVQRQRNGHFYVDATVNGQYVRFLVDTGASMVALTEEDAERVGLHLDPKNYDDIARGAAGVVRGQMVSLDSVEIGGKRAEGVRAAVIEGGDQSLLGESYLAQLHSVEIHGDEMVLR